ncbi:MAG: hypothetical protein AAF490_13760 [Chloroflexota bacterium]
MNQIELARFLSQHFSWEELRILCADLGVDFEELAGRHLKIKSQEIVKFMYRHGRFDELVEYCHQEQPSLIQSSPIPKQNPPPTAPPAPISSKTELNPNTLAQFLIIFFNKDEQSQLASKFGEKYEPLQMKRRPTVPPLIKTLMDKGELEAFVSVAKQTHPELPWEKAKIAEGLVADQPPTYPDTKAILNLIVAAMLDTETFKTLLYEHVPNYSSEELSPSSTKTKALDLIQYLQRRQQLNELLIALKSVYPTQFVQFDPYEREERPHEKQKREGTERIALENEATKIINAEIMNQEKNPPAVLIQKQVLRLPDNSGLRSLIWRSDEEQLLSLTYNNALQTWYTQTGEEATSYRPKQRDKIVVAAPLPNSSEALLVTGSLKNQRLVIQNLANDKVKLELKNLPEGIQTGAVSPDGTWAVTKGQDNSVQVWDLEKARRLNELHGHLKEVNCVHITPDGNHIISGARDETIRIWNKAGELLHTLSEHTEAIALLAVSPNGQNLASVQRHSSEILVWELPEQQRELFGRSRDDAPKLSQILEAHAGEITSLSFAANGRFLASKSYDYTIRLWDCDSWQTAVKMMETTKGKVAFHPQKPLLATGGEKGKVIRIWELAN